MVSFVQINEEFKQITTAELESTFMAQLDLCTPKLLELVSRRGGDSGMKIRQIKDRFEVSTFLMYYCTNTFLFVLLIFDWHCFIFSATLLIPVEKHPFGL